jgi:protein-L-isoaspartate O-methyltransferase
MDMVADLVSHRNAHREHERIRSLMALIPKGRISVLDAGARDGHLSVLLADHFEMVTALDQKKPPVRHRKVTAVQGDITSLRFPDNSFDCVMCTEVLEHVPGHLLEKAAAELKRVARKYVLIGVPYRQDLRVARTTCYLCGKKNPPWGHVNAFDEQRLKRLFPGLVVETISNVGTTTEATNAVSTLLMDLAGNPYGTYEQEETCIHCGSRLTPPPPRNLFQKGCTKLAFWLNACQEPFVRPHPNWIHILFRKPAVAARAENAEPVPRPGIISHFRPTGTSRETRA